MAASDNNNTAAWKINTEQNLTGNAINRLTLATTGSNFETSNLYSARNLDGNKKKVLVINNN